MVYLGPASPSTGAAAAHLIIPSPALGPLVWGWGEKRVVNRNK